MPDFLFSRTQLAAGLLCHRSNQPFGAVAAGVPASKKNAKNAQRGRSKPGIISLPRVSCLLGDAMSWCWFKPASAVPTIWACFPRHAGPPRRAAGRKACRACPACPERSRRERSRRERSRRVAHVCAPKEFPASSLQLRFPESDGPAVPPSRHAGRCCCIPGSRTNHRELHRSPEIGLPTPVSGVRWTPPESMYRTSDLQPQTSRPALSAVEGTARPHKSFIIHSYEKRVCKSFAIHSYKIIGLKVPWNEHLQKNGGGGVGATQGRAFLAAPKCAALHTLLPGSAGRRGFWYIPSDFDLFHLGAIRIRVSNTP